MNIVYLNYLLKFLTFISVILSSSFNTVKIEETRLSVYNYDSYKGITNQNQIEKYDIKYNYVSNLSKGVEIKKQKGVIGISQYDDVKKNYITLQEKKDEIINVGTGKIGIYRGKLTAYGPDCQTCSGLGNVSCRTKKRKIYSLKKDGIMYNDDDFGMIRIVAADQREFPCGTVIKIDNSNIQEPIYAVVMDTGSDMRKAYNNGVIHFDLAFETEKRISKSFRTNNNTSFEVQRWGW